MSPRDALEVQGQSLAGKHLIVGKWRQEKNGRRKESSHLFQMGAGMNLAVNLESPFAVLHSNLNSLYWKFDSYLVSVLVHKREKLVSLLLKLAGRRACC